MDWARAIAINQAALARIVATLVAMLELASGGGLDAKLPSPVYRAALWVLRASGLTMPVQGVLPGRRPMTGLLRSVFSAVWRRSSGRLKLCRPKPSAWPAGKPGGPGWQARSSDHRSGQGRRLAIAERPPRKSTLC